MRNLILIQGAGTRWLGDALGEIQSSNLLPSWRGTLGVDTDFISDDPPILPILPILPIHMCTEI